MTGPFLTNGAHDRTKFANPFIDAGSTNAYFAPFMVRMRYA